MNGLRSPVSSLRSVSQLKATTSHPQGAAEARSRSRRPKPERQATSVFSLPRSQTRGLSNGATFDSNGAGDWRPETGDRIFEQKTEDSRQCEHEDSSRGAWMKLRRDAQR